MEYYKDDFVWDKKAKVPLRVIIVGGGIGGLAAAVGLAQCGHDVTILEQVSKLAEIGAGLQMAPNNTRILGRFGLLEATLNRTTILRFNRVHRWRNFEELARTPFMPEMAERYLSPGGSIHRGDLLKILQDGAEKHGVVIRTSAKVTKVDDDFNPRVQLSSGEWVEGDLVIAADGVKSSIRRQIASAHGEVDRHLPTGDAAYRVIISKEQVGDDEQALKFFKDKDGVRFVGPYGHVVVYPLIERPNPVLNMVLIHPQREDDENDESWTRKGDKKDMIEFHKGWNETLKNLISYVPEGEVNEWTLNTHLPLKSWHENKVVLLGDACHPMLPYVGQGAAQAIEDAGVLALLFTLISSKDEIAKAISIYEKVRMSRAEIVQSSSASNKHSLHLPDGPEQEARDQRMKAAQKSYDDSPDAYGDRKMQDFIWGEDVMKQAREQWQLLSQGKSVDPIID